MTSAGADARARPAMTFAQAVANIERATTLADLGEDAYRSYAKVVHPDAVSDAQSATAHRAFAKLSQLNRRRTLSGDIADLIVEGDRLTKIPRDPADNDLMVAEAEALTKLRDHGDRKYRPYAPRLIETYRHEDERRRRRQVNVLERLAGSVPLSEIKSPRDPRDVAWMWRRLLVALGWAHRSGVIHGAVFEEHVLIHPEQHGLVLVDWCYSGTRPPAVVKSHKGHYPPEVIRDRTAGPATDIYLATGLMTRLMKDPPQPLRRFADGCSYDKPRMRPQDAWRLLGELDEVLHKLYGPRTFRHFTR